MATALAAPIVQQPPNLAGMTGHDNPRVHRLVLFFRSSGGVLLEKCGEGLSLPSIEVPRGARDAREITRFVRDRYGLDTVCLGHPAKELTVLEVIRDGGNIEGITPAKLCSCNWIPRGLLTQPAEAQSIQKAFEYAGSAAGPFCRLGWFEQVTNWIASTGTRLTGPFRQWKGGHVDQLICFEATKGPVWFKAVGKPLITEFRVTPMLARENPNIIPEVLATRPAWRGWLQRDAGGKPLGASEDVRDWEATARSLSQMQIRYLGRADKFLACGAKDHRLEKLACGLEPCFEGIAHAMERQISTAAPRLEPNVLRKMFARSRQLLERVRGWDTADSLTHGDFSPGNILVSPSGPQFIDWSEASVGLPFLTVHYLLIHRRRRYPQHDAWDWSIWTAYEKEWREYISQKTLCSAWQGGPALTALLVLLRVWDPDPLPRQSSSSDPDPKDSEPWDSPYMRSVARQLYRELATLDNQRSVNTWKL